MYFEVIRKICPYLFPFHFDDNKKKTNTSSLTPPQFIEVPIPRKVSCHFPPETFEYCFTSFFLDDGFTSVSIITRLNYITISLLECL
jgi:hypothetical protein